MNKTTTRRSITFAILGGSALAAAGVRAQAGTWIVTSAEAAMPPSQVSQAGRSITRGPAIRQVAPAAPVAANQPFSLKIEFAGRGGEKINPKTAQVVILRGATINATDRFQPFITANGIEMPAAMVPAGTYTLQVSVSDAGGRQSLANVEIEAR